MKVRIGVGQKPASDNQDALVKDTTTRDFMKDVIEPSRKTPVLVDFWAPWCGPCRQLTPMLEKAVKAAKGAVRLVKMNIDEHPDVAAQLGVQSIPAVFAFKDGRPVDGFMGALPESQIKAFITRLLGASGEDGDLVAAADEALGVGDVNQAAELYAAALKQNAENVEAAAGLAKCYIKAGDLKRAEQTLGLIPSAKAGSAAAASARASLELARKSAGSGDLSALEAAVGKNPADNKARFDFALALNGAGRREEAVDQLLEIVRRDRAWNEEAARKQLLEFFEAWGGADPQTMSGRRRLSSLLFS